MRNPALLAAAANVPFPYRPGMYVPWATTKSEITGDKVDAIPGICVLEWMPTVGYSATATDPASVVGKEIFAKVREKFSGSIDVDAPDFVIYIMALSSAFSYTAWLKRIYRTLTAYTGQNHYIPDALIHAMGFSDAQVLDLKEHRMQLYQIINELVLMTRKFNLPAVFDIINRHYWLNDNVYMDADTMNSQFYVFNCAGWYQYDMLDTPQGVKAGGLSIQSLDVPNSGVVEYLFQFGRGLINALASSDDAYIISGYLMRAYEGTPVFTVDELPINDALIPHYDPEVLSQIENALPLRVQSRLQGIEIQNNVTQDPNTNSILCNPKVVGTNVLLPLYLDETLQWNCEQYLSIRSDAPTVADVALATRLKMGNANEVVDKTAKTYTCDIICASEILTSIQIFSNRFDVSTGSMSSYRLLFQGINECGGINFNGALVVQAMCTMQSFDWHPILPYVTPNGIYVAGDVHNFTVLTNEQLRQINRVCLYSVFNSYGQL